MDCAIFINFMRNLIDLTEIIFVTVNDVIIMTSSHGRRLKLFGQTITFKQLTQKKNKVYGTEEISSPAHSYKFCFAAIYAIYKGYERLKFRKFMAAWVHYIISS